MESGQKITLRQASKQLNLPIRTVQWYCNSGLIPHVRRNRSGYRVLEPWQIDLIHDLAKLKQCGLNPKEIRQYARLYRQGAATIPQRIEMLRTRKRQLWQEISERQQAIDFIERKEEIVV